MKTTIKPKPAPRRKVNVNFFSVQETTEEMDKKRHEALQRVMEINARNRARKPPPELKPIAIREDSSGLYAITKLKCYITRPGAQHAQTLPSRIGNRLRYPDGRVTDLAGNPITRSES